MIHNPMTLTRTQLIDALRTYMPPAIYQEITYAPTAVLRGMLATAQSPKDEREFPFRTPKADPKHEHDEHCFGFGEQTRHALHRFAEDFQIDHPHGEICGIPVYVSARRPEVQIVAVPRRKRRGIFG